MSNFRQSAKGFSLFLMLKHSNREIHVLLRESLGVKLLWATRPRIGLFSYTLRLAYVLRHTLISNKTGLYYAHPDLK